MRVAWREGIVGLALLVAVWPAPAAATVAATARDEGGAPDEAAVQEALELADRRIAAGRWETAADDLTALLDGPVPSDAVRAWTPWILARLERCVFELQTEQVALRDLIGPAFAGHDPRDDVLTFVWDGSTPQHPRPEDTEPKPNPYLVRHGARGAHPPTGIAPLDFTWNGRGLVPPFVNRERLSLDLWIDLSGAGRLNATIRVLTFHLDEEDGERLTVSVSTTRDRATGVHRLRGVTVTFRRGGEDTVLEQVTGLEHGPELRLGFALSRQVLEVRIDGERIARVPNRSRRVGRFELGDTPNLRRIEVSGKTDGTWIERLRLQRRSQTRRDFSLERHAPERVPAWLARRAVDDREHGRLTPVSYPGPRTPAFDDASRVIDAYLRKERLADAWEALAPFEGSDAYTFLAWCRAVILTAAGWDAAAANEAHRVMAATGFHDADPGEVPLATRVLAARLLAPTPEVSQAALRALAEEHPGAAGPWEELARSIVADGDPRRAADVVRAALVAGAPPSALAPTADLLIRSEQGPEWDESFEQKTSHFVIRSNISARFCREAGQELEAAWAGYRRILGSDTLGGGRPRMPVYAFATQEGYLAHAQDLLSAEPTRTAGIFSRQLQQVLVWDQPDRQATLRTLRHEALHAFLDARVGDAPPWLHEGLAEYFEDADSRNGRMTPGEPVPAYVLGLDGAPPVSYQRLIVMEPHEFYAVPELHYPHAWRLVHMLLHGGTDERRVLETLIERLATGEDRTTATWAAFDAFAFGELDAAVVAHVKTVRGALVDASR